jgi:hypothetical protein
MATRADVRRLEARCEELRKDLFTARAELERAPEATYRSDDASPVRLRVAELEATLTSTEATLAQARVAREARPRVRAAVFGVASMLSVGGCVVFEEVDPQSSWAFSIGLILFLSTVVCGVLAMLFGALVKSEHWASRVAGVLGGLASLGVLCHLVSSELSRMFKHGRPHRVEGRLARARPSADAPAWTASRAASPAAPSLATLWLEEAQDEHASIAAFAALSQDLLAAGAPPELLVATHAAALDEIEHARATLAIAARYAATSLGFAPCPDLGARRTATPLPELAVASLLDGALNEGAVAAIARARAERAQDPVVRDLQLRIAADEARHAELAWDVLAFCLKRGGEPVRALTARALRSLGDTRPAPRGIHEDLEPHGFLSDDAAARIWAATAASVAERARTLVERRAAA